jgi:hypothetical protein
MFFKAAAWLSVLALAGCATQLTGAGRAIKVVRDGATPALLDCTPLGPVRGQSDSWLSSGDYGVIYATYDARNKAARFPGADTLVITGDAGRRFGGEVTGFAYDCSGRRVTPAAKAAFTKDPRKAAGKSSQAPALVQPGADIFAKAKQCQVKGGVWVNDSCVIPID